MPPHAPLAEPVAAGDGMTVPGTLPPIEADRLVTSFIAACAVPSPARQERAMAQHLQERWFDRQPRWQVWTDDQAPHWGGNQGNILVRIPGTLDVPALAFSAHLDTVGPCAVVNPRREGDYIVTDGTSVLGGDDKAGVVAILAGLAALGDAGVRHGPLEIWFSMAEEVGLCGARWFGLDRAAARRCFVLDASQPVGTAIIAAPSADRLRVTIIGRAAHAGIEPEKGINALSVAAQAIRGMKLGRIDAETTANLGVIEGGVAQNIVMERLSIIGEARSLDERRLERQTAHLRRRFERAATAAGAAVEIEVEREYHGYRFAPDDPMVLLAASAARLIGVEPRQVPAGGGSDANIYQRRGVRALNLGVGMEAVHSTAERLPVTALVDLTRLVMALAMLAANPA